MKPRDSIVLRQAVLDASSFPMLTVLMAAMLAGNLSHHNMTQVVREVKTDISGFRSSPTNISEDRQQCTMTPMQKSVVADALGTLLVAGTAGIQLVKDGVAHLKKIMVIPYSWSSNDQLTLSDLLIAAEIREILPKTLMENLP